MVVNHDLIRKNKAILCVFDVQGVISWYTLNHITFLKLIECFSIDIIYRMHRFLIHISKTDHFAALICIFEVTSIVPSAHSLDSGNEVKKKLAKNLDF